MKSIETFRPVRFTLHLRVARPKRSVGVGVGVGVGADRSASDFQALRTLERATHRRKLVSIVQTEAFSSNTWCVAGV